MLKSMIFRSAVVVACAISMISMSTYAVADASSKEVRLPPPQPRFKKLSSPQKSEKSCLLDVPIPVSVVDTSSLAANNQVKLTDFYTQVPVMSIAPSTMSSHDYINSRYHDRCSGIGATQPITDRRRYRRWCALRRCRSRGSACA